ncbi:MAG: hypothetical protein E7044_11370, partial [Lentisphaerae bacterium]|nr:hypothetical protein [Lentisphaerota bacterium]
MANTLYVGSGQTYQTINDAVAAASATDATTIILAAGTYAEDITLDARTMEQKGNLKFIAAEGAEVTFTGLFTIGYYEKRVGSKKWDADVAFENIIFDQAADDKHSIDIQQVNDFTMTNCKVIGDGEYGILGTNVDNGATITGTTFENAGIQSAGNFGTNLLLEDCTFDESRVNIQSGNSVTIKDCTFDCTVTDANVGDSFYCVRSNDNAIAIENTKFNIDSALTEVASEQGKWGVLWQRNAGGTKWSVSDIEVNFSDAAMSQSELLFNKNGTTTEANEAGRIIVKGMSSADNDITDLFAKSEGTLKALIDTDDGLRYNVYDDGVLQSSTGAETIYVSDKFTANSVPADLLLGFNAFADVNEAEAVAEAGAAKMVIAEGADVTYNKDMYYFLNTNPNEGGENNAFDNVVDAEKTYDMEINGTFRAYQILLNNANTTIGTTGKAFAAGEAFRVMGGSLTVQGSRAEDAGAPGEIFTGSWGGGVKPGADAQISAGYFMVNQEAKVAYNDTVIFVAAGVFNVDNAEADFDNAYIYLGSVGTYADVQLNFTNGADVTFGNNTTVINDDEFGMHMTVDSASSVTVADSEVLTLDTVKNSGSIVLTGDATLEASDLANVCAITITGLTAGSERTVKLSMTAEGEDDGVVIDVAVAADATTASVYVSQFADGSYNAMVIDGNSVKQLGSIAVKTGSIAMDATSTIIADTYAGSKAITVTVDLENFSGVNKIIDLTSPAAGLTLNYVDAAGKALTVEELAAAGINVFTQADGDVLLANVDKTTLFVDGSFKGEFGEEIAEGKYFGLNAFNSFAEALKNIAAETGEISLAGDITEAGPAANTTVSLTENLTISGGNVTWTSASGWVYFAKDANAEGDVTLTFDGFTLNATEAKKAFFIDVDTVIDGNSAVSLYNAKVSSNSTVTVEAGSQFNVYKEELQIDGGSKVVINGSEDFTAAGAELADRQMFLQYSRNVKGDIEINDSYVASYQGFYIRDNGSITADNSLIQLGTGADGVWHYNPVSNGYGELRLNSATAELNLTNGSVLEISGNVINSGTINVDGSSFIANGALVSDGVIKDAQNTGVVTNNGTINVSGESTLVIRDLAGNALTFGENATLVGSNINYTGSNVFGLDGVTFKGDNTINAANYSTSGAKITVAAGASLTATGGRWAFGSNALWNINGSIENVKALTADEKAALTASLSVNGLSLSTGGGEAVMNVKDAYFTYGSGAVTTKNNNVYGGKMTMNFENSYVVSGYKIAVNPTKAGYDAANAPEVVMNFKDSVVEINNYFTNNHAKGTVTIDNTDFTATAFGNTGTVNISNGSKVNFSLVNNGLNDWAGKGSLNAGTITVDASDLTIANAGATLEFYNVGAISLSNGAKFTLDKLVNAEANDLTGSGNINTTFADMVGNITLDNTSQLTVNTLFTNNGSISLDATSSFIANTLDGDGSITIDATGFTEGINKVIDLNGTSSLEGKVTVNGLEEGIVVHYLSDGDVILANADVSVLYVGSQYDVEFGTEVAEGKFAGINAFASFEDALAFAEMNVAVSRIEIDCDITETTTSKTYNITQNLTIGAAEAVTVTLNGANLNIYQMSDNSSVTIEENVTLAGAGIVANGFATSNNELVIDGTLKALSLKQWTSNNKITVSETGKVVLGYGDGQFDMAYGNGVVDVTGTLTDTTDLSAGPQFQAGYSGTRGNGNVLNLTNTYFEAGRDFTF